MKFIGIKLLFWCQYFGKFTRYENLQMIESARKERPWVVCLCGSMRFYEEFQRLEYELELAGKIVLTPGFSPRVGAHQHGGNIDITPEQKARCDELHRRKIDIADSVLVVNVGGYIGESTRGEIEYAKSTGKPVHYVYANPEGKQP